MKVLTGVALSVLMAASPADAANQTSTTGASRIAPTQTQSSIERAHEEQLAREWDLKNEEWARYRELMRGPLGMYSPNLDPLTALGIEARSDEERARYAQLQVRMEALRVERLLAYQRAYDVAWQRLYPTLARVKTLAGAMTDEASTPTGSDARLAVFVKDGCPGCDARVQQLQAKGRPFDLYMVGSRGDDAVIRRWAARVGVDPTKVRQRSITLNHDAGRWLTIGGQGDLPAVLREVNGRWQRE